MAHVGSEHVVGSGIYLRGTKAPYVPHPSHGVGLHLIAPNVVPFTVRLPINPEDISTDEPPRRTVTQTLGGAWVDHFGPGLRTITLRGHTGWRDVAGTGTNGFESFLLLRELVQSFYAAAKEHDPELVRLYYINSIDHNETFHETVRVVVLNFRRLRNRMQPLLYRYEMVLQVVDEAVLQRDVRDVDALKPIIARRSETRPLSFVAPPDPSNGRHPALAPEGNPSDDAAAIGLPWNAVQADGTMTLAEILALWDGLSTPNEGLFKDANGIPAHVNIHTSVPSVGSWWLIPETLRIKPSNVDPRRDNANFHGEFWAFSEPERWNVA